VSVPEGFPAPGEADRFWSLSEDIVLLNHGSFGACPGPVLDHREELLRLIEQDPMEFLLERHQPLLDDTLSVIEQFTGAVKGSIVLVENATTGINTVLRNLSFNPGDSILVSDQEYFSSANALEETADRLGVRVITVRLPYPVESEDEILDSFAMALDPSVRFALVDHAVSSTGMVLPLKGIIDLLKDRGVETIVDGAHGPGQLDLDLNGLGCLAYTGNCHKWLCGPRSSALLYVRPDFQISFKPLVISHLPRELNTQLSDYQLYFRWNGTPDPTPGLSVPFTIRFMGSLLPGGWRDITDRNRQMALDARDLLCRYLGTAPPCPESMVGSMAAVPLGEGTGPGRKHLHWTDPVQNALKKNFGIIVPVTEIQQGKHKLLRISAQVYNSIEQYSYLAESLRDVLNR